MNISKTKSFCKNLSDIKVFFRIERMLSKTFLKKTIRAQKVHAQRHSFFLCSIIITELLSTSLKSELQFLPASEIGKFHTLALNFKDWSFGVIVTRHVRPKLGHLNERIYFKLIDRTSKFIKESGSFLRLISPKLRKLLVFG